MSDTTMESVLSGRVTELRRAFDQSFADPVVSDVGTTIDLISLRLAGDPYAIRMTDIAGLFTDVKITPCPSPIAELRGIAGFRGVLTPVYDLSAWLGYATSSARWLVLDRDRALALAFDAFNGHFRVDPSAVAGREDSSSSRHVREIVRQGDTAWPVIDIPSIVAAIKKRLPQTAASKE